MSLIDETGEHVRMANNLCSHAINGVLAHTELLKKTILRDFYFFSEEI